MAQDSILSADFAPTHANVRGVEEFNRAHRHSYHVHLMKRALPAVAGFIAVVFCILAMTSRLPIADLSVDKVGLKEGKLVMEKPKLAGFDKNSRPYDVTASQAIQDLAKPGKVMLRSIDAKLPMNATAFANIDAKSGVYDTKKEHLYLDDEVIVKGARGMDLHLESANIDIKSGVMESSNPVKVQSQNTSISADSLRVEDNGNRILFNSRVKMTIVRPVERGVAAPQN